MWRKHLSQPFFDDIKNGLKKYEGRLNKGDFSQMQIGDIVTWFFDSMEFQTKIKTKILFGTFKEAIESVGLCNILPSEYKCNSTVDLAIQNVYRLWYSEDDEQKYGVVLLEFELLA